MTPGQTTEPRPYGPPPAKPGSESVPYLFGMTSLFADMTYELAHVLIPVMMMHLGGSAALTGLMESSAEGTKLAGFIGSGRLGTSHERQSHLVRWGYGITVTSTALMGAAGAPAILVLLKSLSWFGKGLRGPARDALLANALPGDLHARAFATVRALDQTGGILGPVFALALVETLSPFTVVSLTVIPGILCVFFAVLATRKALGCQIAASAVERPSVSGFSDDSLKHCLKHAPIRRYLAGGMLLRAGTFPATLLMFRFASGSGTFSLTVLGFLLSSLMTIATNLAVVRGLLPGPPRLLFAVAAGTLPLSSLLLSQQHPIPALYLLSMFFWGIGEAAATLGLKIRGASLWPASLRNQGFALFELVATLLSLLVWPLLAYLWDSHHAGTGMGLSAILALAGGLVLRGTTGIPDSRPSTDPVSGSKS